MRPILILQHQTPERPAYLATWLDQHDILYETRNAGRGERFPDSIEPYSAMAVMGGGMSANDDLMSNRQAEILILQAVFRNRPTIGHCLGGQLMTRALGCTVGASAAPEIGWQPIEYGQDIMAEHWFGRRPTPVVMQYHYEAFTIPEGARRLAGSAVCENQAWSLGPHLAMQFHIEMDENKAREWAADEDTAWAAARPHHATVQDPAGILAGIDAHLEQHQRTADHIYTTWLSNTSWVERLRKNK